MSVKANKKTRDLIYVLCNGIRREVDIVDHLLQYHKEFNDRKATEKAVNYHLRKLLDVGLIYIRDNGRIIDLER
mgnify:FL=1